MAHRLVGAIVILGGLGAAGLGFWGLLQTSTMVSVLPSVAPEIDPENWALHWRASSGSFVLAGFFGLASGIGLIFAKRMAWLMLAVVSCVWVVGRIAVTALGYSRYPFEALDPIELVLMGAVSLGALFAYRNA